MSVAGSRVAMRAARLAQFLLLLLFPSAAAADDNIFWDEARAYTFAKILAESVVGPDVYDVRYGGYFMMDGHCFISIDARMQNRISISRAGTRTTLLFRCNAFKHLEHDEILNRARSRLKPALHTASTTTTITTTLSSLTCAS